MAAAAIQFDENFAQKILSKNYILLQLLFKCGCNKSAATNTVITLNSVVGIKFDFRASNEHFEHCGFNLSDYEL